MVCSLVHKFVTCLSRYQFTGRNIPLQILSGVAILMSLQDCGFFSISLCTGQPPPESHKIRLAFHFIERNSHSNSSSCPRLDPITKEMCAVPQTSTPLSETKGSVVDNRAISLWNLESLETFLTPVR